MTSRKIIFLLVSLILLSIVSCSTFSYRAVDESKGKKESAKVEKLNTEEYFKRLEDLLASEDNSEFEYYPLNLRLTPEVKKYLVLYTEAKRRDIQIPLKLRADYLPTIERVMNHYNLPSDLSNLAFVESKFNVSARSPQGALGLWQFMKPTARAFGLECNHQNDDRKDVLLSTVAAAKYLKQLRDRFDDWLLAIAAYNAGPARISAAIKTTGGERDFYKLARQNLLPSETVDHVSKFIAISIITNNLSVYNFNEPDNSVLAFTNKN